MESRLECLLDVNFGLAWVITILGVCNEGLQTTVRAFSGV